MDSNRKATNHGTAVFRLAGALTLAASAVVIAPNASAEDTTHITNFATTYDVQKDGTIKVHQAITVNFTDPNKHGIEDYLLMAQRFDSKNHRVYPVSGIRVEDSGHGGFEVEAGGSGEVIRIGDADRTVSGIVKYDVYFTQDGLVTKTKDGASALYINAIGSGWRTPIDQASVTVHGPAAMSDATCWQGNGPSQSQKCSGTASGNTAQYSARNVGNGRSMTIDARVSTSAFSRTGPILKDGPEPEAPGVGGPFTQSTRAEVNKAAWGAGAVGVVGAGSLGALMVRRSQRNERFADVTPGELPMGTPKVMQSAKDPDVAVRFEPPRGVTPGLVAVNCEKRTKDQDVSATLVDLAVRGFITLTDLGDDDWLITQQPAPSGETLLTYEAQLLNALFMNRHEVKLSELKDTFATDLKKVKTSLWSEAENRSWFRTVTREKTDLQKVCGATLALIGLVATFVGVNMNINIWPVTVVLMGFGVFLFVMTLNVGPRTASGSAVFDQARGFRQYLATAEASQFKFEDAERIFSRYMPYAMVFGLARRWARLFGEVAARAESAGQPIIMPTWYIGGWGGGFSPDAFSSLGDSLQSFNSAAATSMTSTPGGSGGSGFSGGFAGGGAGGGGGGTW